MAELYGTRMSRRELQAHMGRLDQVGGVTEIRLSGGRAEGTRGAVVRTGAGLAFTVLADRALDISHAEYQGIPLSWRSPNGDAHPTYYDDDDDEWLRTFFGGLVTTCGLTNSGPAGEDELGTYGLHGRISCIPAEGFGWAEAWEGDECVFRVWGTMRQSRVFGENLTLRREITARLGGLGLELHDVVENEGFERAPHQILYHCNGGFPILMPGAKLQVSHRSVRPRDADAERGLTEWGDGGEPRPGFREQVFIHEPVACSDGRAAALLANRELRDGEGLGLLIRWDVGQLPAFFNWRMLGAGTYVMGMEPSNCPTQGRAQARERGDLPFLEPGEVRRYDLEFRVLTTRDGLDRHAWLIEEASQRGRRG